RAGPGQPDRLLAGGRPRRADPLRAHLERPLWTAGAGALPARLGAGLRVRDAVPVDAAGAAGHGDRALQRRGVGWATVLLAVAVRVFDRGTRKLVLQGG